MLIKNKPRLADLFNLGFHVTKSFIFPDNDRCLHRCAMYASVYVFEYYKICNPVSTILLLISNFGISEPLIMFAMLTVIISLFSDLLAGDKDQSLDKEDGQNWPKGAGKILEL